MTKSVNIMGFDFLNTSMEKVIIELDVRLERGLKTFIVTANPEIIMYAQTDSEYKEIVKKADFIIPDGIGVIIASKILGQPISERLPGFDLMGKLLELSNDKGYSIYLLGTQEEVIKRTKKKIEEVYPKIKIVGYHNGYFDWNDPALLKEVKESRPDLILVGLGFPKQERWIYNNMGHFDKGVFIGVGGSLDVWGGKVKRAPVLWQRMNLEWLYRLIKQPSRWRRMLVLPVFVLKVFKLRYQKDKRKG